MLSKYLRIYKGHVCTSHRWASELMRPHRNLVFCSPFRCSLLTSRPEIQWRAKWHHASSSSLEHTKHVLVHFWRAEFQVTDVSMFSRANVAPQCLILYLSYKCKRWQSKAKRVRIIHDLCSSKSASQYEGLAAETLKKDNTQGIEI
jgi:hypothetical protein